MCATPAGGAAPNPYPNVAITTDGSGNSITVDPGDLTKSSGDQSPGTTGIITMKNMKGG